MLTFDPTRKKNVPSLIIRMRIYENSPIIRKLFFPRQRLNWFHMKLVVKETFKRIGLGKFVSSQTFLPFILAFSS